MKGFDRSRIDVGARETRITIEQTPVYDRDGNLVHGLAAPTALEDLLDLGLAEADPPVTRLGTIIQAVQSEMWSALELAASDVERQWYLRRSQDLQRFSDWLRCRARDLTREELRRRLLDLMIAYTDSGATRAIRRVAGAYTGQPAFVTRTRDYPGYWEIGVSYVTPSHLFVPDKPLDGLRVTEASGAHPVGELALLSVTSSSDGTVTLSWKAPGDGPGAEVTLVGVGVYLLRSANPDIWVRVQVDPERVRAAAVAGLAHYTVAVLEAPDTCQNHENWLPGSRNLASGVWIETFGQASLSQDAAAEFRERLRDVADLGPLNHRPYALEQPTFQRVPSEIAWFWERTYPNVQTFDPTIVVPFGAGVFFHDASGGGASGFGASGGGASGFSGRYVGVPICTGPFVTIKERYNEFEEADGSNFTLGATFAWEARDEVVSQPTEVSGVQIIQIAVDVPSGRGQIAYDPSTESILWQAPSDEGLDGLDPRGAGARLSSAAVIIDQPTVLTGVRLQNAAVVTPTGGGVLRYDQIGQTLSWQAPGDLVPGSPVAIPGVSESLLTLRSSTTTYSVEARVVTASLPTSDTEETLAVHAASSVPGVAIVGVSALTRSGDGTLRYTPDDDGNTVSWQAPGDTRGPEVVIAEDGWYAVPSGDGAAVLYITVTVGALTDVEAFAVVTVAGIPIGSSREVRLASGNPLYEIRVRILQTQLQNVWVWDDVRVRTAQLDLRPVGVPSPSGGVESAILDRLYAESVRRKIWSRSGSSEDPNDGSWTDWSPIDVQSVVPVRPPDRSVTFRVRLEPDPNFVGFPHTDQYDLVAAMLRPRLPVRTPGCCADDDALRVATGGLLAACGRQTDLGLVTGGLLGYMTTVYCDSEVPPVPEVDPENPGPSL